MYLRRNLGDVLLPGDGSSAALIDLSSGAPRRFSAIELDDRANAMACAVARQGFLKGARIGLLARNSVDFLVCYLGILRAGFVVVPISYKFPKATVEFICEDAEIEHLFSDRPSQDLCPENVQVTFLEAFDEFLEAGRFTSIRPSSGQTAIVLYTSGSTGRPKGVELSHESQWAIVEGMSSPDIKKAFQGRTGIVAAPLFHMNGLAFCEIMLFLGGTTVLLPRFEAEHFVKALSEHQVNIITGVPTMLALLAGRPELFDGIDTSAVDLVWVGSAPLSDLLIEQAQTLFPRAIVLNGYGTTETGAGTFGPHPHGAPRPPLSIGYPMPHAEVRLVGEDDGEQGVLEIRSPSNMTRYLNLPEVTAQKMRDGWVNTGDIMRKDKEGFFYFVGRNDDMFVCSGENIYPGELERVLERHPLIIEVCVVPHPDEVRGQIPVAFVVCRPDVQLSMQEVKDHALRNASPHMHPRHVFFLSEMPLAGTNKIDRRALAKEAGKRLRLASG